MATNQNYTKHAKERACQRYGLLLNTEVCDEIIKNIQNNNSILVSRQSNRKAIYYVCLGKKLYKVVYIRRKSGRKCIPKIITFLPVKWKEYGILLQNQEELSKKTKTLKSKVKYWFNRAKYFIYDICCVLIFKIDYNNFRDKYLKG